MSIFRDSVLSLTTILSHHSVTRNRVIPLSRSTRGQLKNGRHDSSDTEVGVLIAINSRGQISPKRGAFRHRSMVIRTHTNSVPTREVRTSLPIRRLLIHVLVVSPCLS
ncbi:hypothetical protein AVEN_196814-1 [Araneus ventricosus]|uniref:Uncharacterized protein n=1 Tax=Araneus ventricosus TaxID=182803 RepID=A0A4Y2JGF5_ARAVE|nr:hypothetical protein AVEN_196814-1 [Araneus ventricosus]